MGVSASGLDANCLAARLPDALKNLEPVLQLTVGGRARAELDGLVQLLDRKVVDPRLLRKLLGFQASQLTWRCFQGSLKEFRFTANALLPALHQKMPLNLSLLALLIDAARQCDPAELPNVGIDDVYTRRAIRSQNLDRAGVSAQHMQLLKALAERCSAEGLAAELKLSRDEVVGVLWALEFAELAERHTKSDTKQVVVFDSDPLVAQKMRSALSSGESRYFGKVVRDRFGLQLALRRACPDALVLAIDAEGAADLLRELRGTPGGSFADAKCIGIVPAETDQEQVLKQLTKIGLRLDGLIERPFEPAELFGQLDGVFDSPPNTSDDAPPPARQAAPWTGEPVPEESDARRFAALAST